MGGPPPRPKQRRSGWLSARRAPPNHAFPVMISVPEGPLCARGWAHRRRPRGKPRGAMGRVGRSRQATGTGSGGSRVIVHASGGRWLAGGPCARPVRAALVSQRPPFWHKDHGEWTLCLNTHECKSKQTKKASKRKRPIASIVGDCRAAHVK